MAVGEFDGRVVAVTGGSRGIGRATCVRFAETGAHVLVQFHRDRAAADEVVATLERNGVEAEAIQADLASAADAERIVERALARWGRLDVLVNNAGIWHPSPIDTVSAEDWEQTIQVNLCGAAHACRAASRAMKQTRSGSIINVSSTAGQRGEARYSNYAASKGGLIGLTKSLAPELAPWNIRVNCVAPGWVETDMTTATLESAEAPAILSVIPAGRFGRPEEIAHAIAFLASDGASYINGEVLNVNGGSVLCG